jgi:hypothetical protein
MTGKRSGVHGSSDTQDGGESNGLSDVDRAVLFDLLAQGHTPAVVRDRLLEECGIAVSLDTIRGYRKSHAGEIAKRREKWRETLRNEPMAHARNRVRELAQMYGQAVLAQYHYPCPACLGRGYVRKQTGKAICRRCKGRKMVLPPDLQKYVKEMEGDIRLETMPELPPNPTPSLVGRCMQLLARIRKEVGDDRKQNHRSRDREGSANLYSPETIEDRRAERELLAAVLRARTEEICEIYRARSEARSSTPRGGEARCPLCGSDGNRMT